MTSIIQQTYEVSILYPLGNWVRLIIKKKTDVLNKKNYFLNFSTKTYVAGIQKNRLDEMVLLSTQKQMFKQTDKKILTSFMLKNCVYLDLWLYRESYMSAHALLNLLNELVEKR